MKQFNLIFWSLFWCVAGGVASWCVIEAGRTENTLQHRRPVTPPSLPSPKLRPITSVSPGAGPTLARSAAASAAEFTVQLSWDAADSVPLAGYWIEMGQRSGFYSNALFVATNEARLATLNTGVWFAVFSALGTNGLLSDRSAELRFTNSLRAVTIGITVIASTDPTAPRTNWRDVVTFQVSPTNGAEFYGVRVKR